MLADAAVKVGYRTVDTSEDGPMRRRVSLQGLVGTKVGLPFGGHGARRYMEENTGHPQQALLNQQAEANATNDGNSGRLGYRMAKRAFDVVFSAAVIAIGAVPAIVLAAAIRHESPGSPIYRQERVNGIGPDGRPRTFTMYKFRSMYADADERLVELKAAGMNEADGPLFKMRDDPRVTRIGRFMRKHSIDEMPQFVNALLGDMSIVGPRPPLPDEVSEYGNRAMQTLLVKPGLTSYWQVSGRSDTTFDHKVNLDMDYIRDQSVTTDLKLVGKTIGIVITGGGRLLAALFAPLPRGASHAA